jgi:hypothetical protein
MGKPHIWGDFYPSEYPSVARFFALAPDIDIFNIWLWQNRFKAPSECSEDGNSVRDWLVAERLSLMTHKDLEVGMAAARYTPQEFQKYLVGSRISVPFMYQHFKLRKTYAVALR